MTFNFTGREFKKKYLLGIYRENKIITLKEQNCNYTFKRILRLTCQSIKRQVKDSVRWDNCSVNRWVYGRRMIVIGGVLVYFFLPLNTIHIFFLPQLLPVCFLFFIYDLRLFKGFRTGCSILLTRFIYLQSTCNSFVYTISLVFFITPFRIDRIYKGGLTYWPTKMKTTTTTSRNSL